MHCDQTEKISLLIDGELSTEDVRSLEKHLSTCSQCEQVRADFLGLRDQISAYAISGELLPPRPALAKILSKSHARPSAREWLRFPSFGGATQFTRFAAVAACLLVALGIGTIAYLSYSPQREAATNIPASPSTDVRPSSDAPVPPELLARNPVRKPSKAQPRETAPDGRKPNSRIKPGRERSAPKPLPQLQNSAPPTYAFSNGLDGANDPASNRAGDTEALTASHFEQSELLLRAFRNLRPTQAGRTPDIAYERRRAQQLLYRNIILRREADNDGDVQVATLLGSLEPILLDIANLRDKPRNEELRAIKERVERQSLVALLQVNSAAIARAFE